jgi:general secretion pathway protein D
MGSGPMWSFRSCWGFHPVENEGIYKRGHERIPRKLQVSLALFLFLSLLGSISHAAKLAEKVLEEEGRLVTMDFRGVEIGTLVKFIGELTGKNFVVDERVRGKVTVISPTKITVEEAYKVFESILEVHGFATVPAGKVIKVVPATEARGKSITTMVGTEVLPAADTMITQVIPIRHATVSDVKAFFTPLVSKSSLLVAYQPTNTLIVTDVLSNINRLLKILKEVDIPGYALQLAVIPLQYASAEAVSQELKTLFEARKRAPRAPRPKVQEVEISAPEELKLIPDERTNSLIVLATAQTIQMIKGIIAKLDQEIPRGKGNIHVYYLQHAVADDLATILTGVAKEAKEGAKPGSSGITGKLPVLGEKISVLAEKTTNTLIIIASPQDYAVLEEVIKKLDIVRAQVYVETLIAEVTLDKVKDLGVEWNVTATPTEGEYRQHGGTDFGLIDALQEGALQGLLMAVTKGYIGSTDIPDIKALLHFYSGDSDVNVLSTPRLLTTDNEEAEIIVGEERPFLKSSQLTTEGSTVRTWEYKDVGITLKITPHISKGKLLRLSIFTEIKSFVEELAGEVGAVVTTKRQATTSVIVEDGSTVVIAGLIRDDKTGSVAKVPLLGDIPLLGWLFKSRTQTKIKTNLLIFITPRIVTSAEDLRKISEEEKGGREKHIEEHRKEKKKVFPLFENGD